MTAMRRPLPTLLAFAVPVLCLLLAGAPRADAKLSSKEWKETETLFKTLFRQRGNPKGKAAVLAKVIEDGTSRAWRTMAQALLLEVELWAAIQDDYVRASNEHGEILQRSIKGYTAVDENRAKELQAQMKQLEADQKAEGAALQAVVTAVTGGPEELRKNILQRALTASDWQYRAAAIRVAVATMGEKPSRSFLNKALVSDKDPRVRIAGLDALASAAEGWEGLVLGRLGDSDWGVVLRAVHVVEERGVKAAVPHLINALPRATPRLAEGIGKALRTLTGENFEAYADIWNKWWKEHKQDFEGDVAVKGAKQKEFGSVHFYGVEIKSDRVLFIIDISGSMKLETKNDNPAERYKPPPTVTGGKAPPPPPPPESIMSGPKIEVAKDELKKAIRKMPEDWTFNMIAFNQGAVRWQQSMQKATKKTKESAYKWVRSLKPHGSTYIDGALKEGFTIAGLIDFDSKYPDITLDTIVLLSDGAPTSNGYPVSKLMEPKVILEHVRTWNKDKKVVIHTISVDMIKGIEFMKKLSAENGGVHVDR